MGAWGMCHLLLNLGLPEFFLSGLDRVTHLQTPVGGGAVHPHAHTLAASHSCSCPTAAPGPSSVWL